MRIIGVDPGLVSTGWGVIELRGTSLSFLGCGTISPKKDLPLSERLLVLHRELTTIIAQHAPHPFGAGGDLRYRQWFVDA